jgi:hypothetical protein
MEGLPLKDTGSKYLRGEIPFRQKRGKAKSNIGNKYT